MKIGDRVEVYVAHINGVPQYAPGTVVRIHPPEYGVERVDVAGDDGRHFGKVHPTVNLRAIILEAQ